MTIISHTSFALPQRFYEQDQNIIHSRILTSRYDNFSLLMVLAGRCGERSTNRQSNIREKRLPRQWEARLNRYRISNMIAHVYQTTLDEVQCRRLQYSTVQYSTA